MILLSGVDTSNRTDEQMSYVFSSGISLHKLNQCIQVHPRISSFPQERRHGTPHPSQHLLNFPSLPTPTFPNNPYPVCGKEGLQRRCLSFLEAVLRVASYHLFHKSGQRRSFPSCSSFLRETTELMPNYLPLWFPNYSTHHPRKAG